MEKIWKIREGISMATANNGLVSYSRNRNFSIDNKI